MASKDKRSTCPRSDVADVDFRAPLSPPNGAKQPESVGDCTRRPVALEADPSDNAFDGKTAQRFVLTQVLCPAQQRVLSLLAQPLDDDGGGTSIYDHETFEAAVECRRDNRGKQREKDDQKCEKEIN